MDSDDGATTPGLDDRLCAVLAGMSASLPDRGALVICGFPASGKSTAARWLASRMQCGVLDKDAFASRLEHDVMGRLTGDRFDRDSEVYRSVVSPGIYEGLIRTGLSIAARHLIVLDGPFLSVIRQANEAKRSLAQHLRIVGDVAGHVVVHTVWLDTSPELIRERMQVRGAERDASKLADWETYRQSVLDSGIREIARTIVDVVVDT